MSDSALSLIDSLKFENGLIPAIVQDEKTGDVLMFAFMNKEALKLTLETKIAHYWSRSRKSLWKKGETSGHYQYVKEVLVDCDEDAVLLLVEQVGGACHTGYQSCFYRKIDGKVIGQKVFDAEDVY
ncbi:phosphoribosyl-AMP cyclohydrolase [Methanolapillus millepedarum]|uniref:Phosphoribosyl-AMP cyclohydrolase n=1 Tax=Methanolapillus millepedarum TaxID=3028296 RepID=A0AA96V3Z8_9EURY|nr:Phosphoribosyl-AMP cyclohydrolase [Methanosarcinaceae archaeon Ac7]